MTDKNADKPTKTDKSELTEEEQLEQMIAEEEAAKNDPPSETFEDELPAHIEESMQDPDYAAAEATLAGDPDDSKKKGKHQEGVNPDGEQPPMPPVAPAAVDPAAVETTASGLKFGWQQPPAKEYPSTMHCSHIGTVAAKQQVKFQEIGDTWVCTCGDEFVIALNTGGKKILKAKKL